MIPKSIFARPLPSPGGWLLALALSASAWAESDYSTPYAFTTLAGTSSIGSTDGVGRAARFYQPQGVAADSAGNLYVADSDNNTIRKISPAGVVTTLAGAPGERGGTDGPGQIARFNFPSSLVVDATGNVYVADANNHAIRKITPAGTVTTLAGAAGVSGGADGNGASARFHRPEGIAVDPAGNLYVADAGNHTVRKITPGGVVTTLAGSAQVSGSIDGPGSEARFSTPFRIAIDATGTLYVSDSSNWDIRKITPAGVVTTFLPASYHLLHGSRSPVNMPAGIAVTAAGRIYFADSNTDTINEISPAGVVTPLAGGVGQFSGVDDLDSGVWIMNPVGLAADAAGNLYVADRANNSIRKISPTGVVTAVAGLDIYDSHGNADGAGSLARFEERLNVTVGSTSGYVYVADTFNHTVRRISPGGDVTTLAGMAGARGSADGAGSAARFNNPRGLAVDAAGNVYVADTDNYTIRKITPAGVVSTLAGTAGVYGTKDGTGSNARFIDPTGIAVDSTGALYVTEPWNVTIRKISPTGTVTTLAGVTRLQDSVDGTGSTARFLYPQAIAVDSAGNAFVADENTIRKITPDGVVSTLAGLAGTHGSNDGTGSAARFNGPEGLSVDSSGNIYVTDRFSHTLRKVTSGGTVTTLAGLAGYPGYADGLADEARFYGPQGVAVDLSGNVYVTSDTTVRKGQLAGPPVITTQPQSLTAAAGSSVQFSVAASGVPTPSYQWYYNGNPFTGARGSTLSFTNARTSDAGDYTLVATNALGTVTSNKATLTVTAAPAPAPASAPSSGGGGGAIEEWFVLALLALGATRRLTARRSP